jgi:hypothetical protein
MPSPTTAYDLIKGAMRKVGITAAGDTPTPDEANDALSDLNDLIESMNLDNLAVWGSASTAFTTVAGQATRTIGPTGQFVGDRPVRVTNAYCTFGGVDYPIEIIGQEEYDNIILKTQQSQIIERMAYVNDNPNGLLYMWPVPQSAIPIVIGIDRLITTVASTATVMTFPPGYLKYMMFELGIALAPEYGVSPMPDVVKYASTTRAALKRANKLKRKAYFDPALTMRSVGDWRTGN